MGERCGERCSVGSSLVSEDKICKTTMLWFAVVFWRARFYLLLADLHVDPCSPVATKGNLVMYTMPSGCFICLCLLIASPNLDSKSWPVSLLGLFVLILFFLLCGAHNWCCQRKVNSALCDVWCLKYIWTVLTYEYIWAESYVDLVSKFW